MVVIFAWCVRKKYENMNIKFPTGYFTDLWVNANGNVLNWLTLQKMEERRMDFVFSGSGNVNKIYQVTLVRGKLVVSRTWKIIKAKT